MLDSFGLVCFLSLFFLSVYLVCGLVYVVLDLLSTMAWHCVVSCAYRRSTAWRCIILFVVACDHRACVSLKCAGCRWVKERFHGWNTVPQFQVRITYNSMVLTASPCFCTRCVRLSFAYYSEKRQLRTFGPITWVWSPYYYFPWGFNSPLSSQPVRKCTWVFIFISIIFLCCLSLHRQQILSGITSSPLSTAATKHNLLKD